MVLSQYIEQIKLTECQIKKTYEIVTENTFHHIYYIDLDKITPTMTKPIHTRIQRALDKTEYVKLKRDTGKQKKPGESKKKVGTLIGD